MSQDISNLSGEELQGAVQSILSNPAFSQLLGQLQGKGDSKESKTPSVPTITPEMMQKLPQMMSALAPLVGGGGKESSSGGTGKGPSDGEKRKRLLAALRPYLSDSRRGAVDQILKVTEMTDLLGALGEKKEKP